ncbi:MAG: GNAT family N-acetyltransferase [Chloroflexota bacterium]
MNITIRPADPQTDYEHAAEIISTFERDAVSADTLREWDRIAEAGSLRRRMVAVEGEQIVGYSLVSHNIWDKNGLYIAWVVVDPARRGQGIGARLWQEAQDFAQAHGAQLLSAEVLDNDPVSLGFAEKRGYVTEHHMFESVIDLKTFDPTPFEGVLEAVKADGIRFFSLADAGDTREARHKLWEVNYTTALEDPSSTGSFPDAEALNHIFNTNSWFRPDGQILAADGENYVGLSAVGYYKDSNSAYNLMTGVMQAYRGRKIALALKLLSIRAAQNWGVDTIRTNNDSQNAPMLAINRKLGYVPQPGIFRMTRTL